MFDLVHKSENHGTRNFQAVGRLTHSTMSSHESFDEFLKDNLDQSVIVDLERLEIIDSTGIGWLLKKNREFSDNGGRLVLHSLQPNVAKVFGMMKLGAVLTVVDSENAANDLIANSGVEQ